MHHPPCHPCRQPSCPMRDRAPIPAPIVASPTHCLSHTHWRHSCLQCRGERSALLCTQRWATTRSASSTTSNERRIVIVAEKVRPPHYVHSSVCQGQCSMRTCLLPAACRLHRLPPTTYYLLPTAYVPPAAAYFLRLPPTACRLPPAACACACRLGCIRTAYHLHRAYVHVPLSPRSAPILSFLPTHPSFSRRPFAATRPSATTAAAAATEAG